jgi:hypothetical protein
MITSPKGTVPVQFLQTHFFRKIFPEARSFPAGGDTLRGISQVPEREVVSPEPFTAPETESENPGKFGLDTLQGLVIVLADESSKIWHKEGSKRGGLSKAVRAVVAKYEWSPEVQPEKLVTLVCSELGARGNRKRHAWPKDSKQS